MLWHRFAAGLAGILLGVYVVSYSLCYLAIPASRYDTLEKSVSGGRLSSMGRPVIPFAPIRTSPAHILRAERTRKFKQIGDTAYRPLAWAHLKMSGSCFRFVGPMVLFSH